MSRTPQESTRQREPLSPESASTDIANALFLPSGYLPDHQCALKMIARLGVEAKVFGWCNSAVEKNFVK